MNTNMTGFRWFSKICVLWRKVASALEVLNEVACIVMGNNPFPFSEQLLFRMNITVVAYELWSTCLSVRLTENDHRRKGGGKEEEGGKVWFWDDADQCSIGNRAPGGHVSVEPQLWSSYHNHHYQLQAETTQMEYSLNLFYHGNLLDKCLLDL